ncbi:DNA-binding transcriptional regulator, LysR family [Bowdeniella nasicola]|uniref:DNA-binding transcriptional regulator, LysR family n=1 Tax=Bowdeniella nasicola TaxID=208480 RepID=A0A1H4CR73_9ACTO|nr:MULTISPECIES: LysR family transcriptional regulator [Bowdeniella]SEA62779.1 DNA-binding transcriptional regulator, LysR family [Bowdeniella nasicola]
MDLNSRRLGILLAIHRDGGVVSAADSLHMSPSAVSQQIQQLEREVGVAVIERTPHGSILTPAGRILADLAETIETESFKASRSLAGLAGQVTGSVVIGGFQTAIRNILIPLLPRVSDQLPGVQVSIREVVEKQGMRELRSGIVDLLIMERDFEKQAVVPRGMRDVPYADEPWLLVQPSGDARPSSISDLTTTTWLGVEPAAASAQAIERLQSALPDPEISIHRYADYDVALDMIRAGLGSTVLPRLAVSNIDTEGIQITRLPGLGVRQLVIRHREAAGGLEPAHEAVLQLLVETASIVGLPGAGSIDQ